MNRVEPIDAAVIDVGSNSVRLVVYRLEGRAIWQVYNEKVLAGLGRDIASTGRLNEAGVAKTLIALRRFQALLGEKTGARIFAVATAAVRDAEDGPAFVARVRAETGLSLRVLTGEEEARYSALGVAAGLPDASGVVGDLGGGSLELIAMDGGRPGAAATFPVGPFALIKPGSYDARAIEAEVARRLEPAGAFAARTFHAVGGAWRNLALIHMHMTGYPLEIIHEYRLSGNEALETARLIARQSRGSLERMGSASKKRAETLPYAATVLTAVIERLDVREVIFSAFGLREGLLFESMTPEVRALDPLVTGLAALARRPLDAEALGSALDRWLSPAFAGLNPVLDGRDALVISAACRLADFGARLHPDHRANLALEQVLRAPVAGQTHTERAFLAVAIFARHTAIVEPDEQHILSRLLDFSAQRRAKAVGAAIRLGSDLCGRNPALLRHSRLDFDEETVTLTADANRADLLLGDQTRRRAETLAATLGRRLVVRSGEAR